MMDLIKLMILLEKICKKNVEFFLGKEKMEES